MCALGPCPPWRGLRSGRPEASRPWLRLPHTYLRLYPRCPHPGASCWGGPLAEDAIRRLRRSPSLGPRSHFGHSDSVHSTFPLSPFPPLSLLASWRLSRRASPPAARPSRHSGRGPPPPPVLTWARESFQGARWEGQAWVGWFRRPSQTNGEEGHAHLNGH